MKSGVSSDEISGFWFEEEWMEEREPYVEASGVAATGPSAAAVEKSDGGEMRRTEDIHRQCHRSFVSVEEESVQFISLSFLFFLIYFINLSIS